MRTLQSNDVRVTLTGTQDGRTSILVEPLRDVFIPFSRWVTSYPHSLIEKELDIFGPYLIDDIRRDEDPDYVEKELRNNIFLHMPDETFAGKRLLDFGCGSGASAMILSRMFPEIGEIVGVELVARHLEVARARARYYGFDNISFKLSPAANRLPDDLGEFDVVMLSAVFEHLLPSERRPLLELLWSAMKPGAVLFINQTPNRWFPVEIHTTGGIPGLNFLPKPAVEWIAKRFSDQVREEQSWEDLLRAGIRGGSEREIMALLPGDAERLLPPGIRDGIDIWYKRTRNRSSLKKRVAYAGFKAIAATGLVMLPYHLNMAIRKLPGRAAIGW